MRHKWKCMPWITELTCFSMDSSASSTAPKLWTDILGLIWACPTVKQILYDDNVEILFLEAISMHSVLASFNINLFESIHLLTSAIQSSILVITSSREDLSLSEKRQYNWVSSAYPCRSTLCFSIMDPRGRIYIKKRSGPNTEPWGTPTDRGTCDEDELPIRMVCWRSDRYDLSHCNAVPLVGWRAGKQ